MRISVVGGGYVGLVSGVCLSELGHSVNLIEIDSQKVKAINLGRPPIYEKGLEEMLSAQAVYLYRVVEHENRSKRPCLQRWYL